MPNQNWNKYIGSIWARLLSNTSLPKQGNIVEIAPGDVNKLGYALSSCKFQGNLYVVEPNARALASIIRQYREALLKARVIPVHHTLREAVDYLPVKPVIISNHPLDDMIIGKSLGRGSDDFFSDHYDAPPEKTRVSWQELKAVPGELENAKLSVIGDWMNLFKKVKPRLVVISQYESYFFKNNNIREPDKHGFEVLQKIRKNCADKEIQITDSINEIKDLSRWLALMDLEG